MKLNPLADWTLDQVWDYVRDARGALPRALRPRVHLDRLRAVHAPGRARGTRAGRPLVVGAGHREGMRHPLQRRSSRGHEVRSREGEEAAAREASLMPFGYPVMLELSRATVRRDRRRCRTRRQGRRRCSPPAPTTCWSWRWARRTHSTSSRAIDGVAVERRSWRAADLNGAFLVRRREPRPGERDAIAREARARRVLVNLIDDIPNCDWAAPSVVRRGELVLAISTGGASPALAKKLRAQLDGRVRRGVVRGPARSCATVRAETMPSLPDFADPGAPMGARRSTSTRRRRSSREGRGDELAAQAP